MFTYFWRRERQSVSGGGAEREEDTESEAGSRLRAGSTEPPVGLQLKSCEIMTWAKIGGLTDWTTQAPLVLSEFKTLQSNFSTDSVYTESINAYKTMVVLQNNEEWMSFWLIILEL